MHFNYSGNAFIEANGESLYAVYLAETSSAVSHSNITVNHAWRKCHSISYAETFEDK